MSVRIGVRVAVVFGSCVRSESGSLRGLGLGFIQGLVVSKWAMARVQGSQPLLVTDYGLGLGYSITRGFGLGFGIGAACGSACPANLIPPRPGQNLRFSNPNPNEPSHPNLDPDACCGAGAGPNTTCSTPVCPLVTTKHLTLTLTLTLALLYIHPVLTRGVTQPPQH